VADRLEILQIEGEYARTWDTVDADGWAALFTPDGVFEMVAIGDRPASRFEGRAALAQFCRDINASYEGLHLIHNPSLRIEGDLAFGWIHFEFRYLRTVDGTTTHGDTMGVYEVEYVRTDDGWKIRERVETAVTRGTRDFHAIPRRAGA
jgi:uncharacterized protein (TIGR02246 family)